MVLKHASNLLEFSAVVAAVHLQNICKIKA